MNSENFYFNIASKTDLGKKISRLYLIGNISKEEYTDKIRNIAEKMKADDAFVESLNIESIKDNLDACINLFEAIDEGDTEGFKRNFKRNSDLLKKIQAYYERFDIAPIGQGVFKYQYLGDVADGFGIACSLISKEEILKQKGALNKAEADFREYMTKPTPWYNNMPKWVGYIVMVIGVVVIGWLMYINI